MRRLIDFVKSTLFAPRLHGEIVIVIKLLEIMLRLSNGKLFGGYMVINESGPVNIK